MGCDLINNEQKARVLELALKALDDDMLPAESQELEKYISSSKALAAYYSTCIKMHLCMVEIETSHCLPKETSDSSLDHEFWQMMAIHEKTAPETAIPQEKQEKELVQKINRNKIEYRISRSSLYSIVTSVAAIILIALFVRYAPKKGGGAVAILTDSLNAKWVDAEKEMVKGTSITTGEKSLFLHEGYAELLFGNQAKVTIQGPAEFEVLSEDQIKLSYGRLYAMVPREAIGFTVKTPSTQIVDLGTEFGVDCGLHSDTSLHVIKGKTVLIAGDKSNKMSVEVGKGIAKKVSGNTQAISDISCNDRLFVREIDSADNLVWRGETEISLADIVGGGSGFGEIHSLIGLDPGTGEYRSSIGGTARGSENDYNPVTDSAFIDGVFVPDGGPESGEILISSANDMFHCPDTSGQFTYGIAVYTGDIRKQHKSISPAIFGGHTYGNNDIVMIHSNAGITFDLAAIRQLLPDVELTHFTAFGGISEAITEKVNPPDVDFWVVVDGQIRYEKTALKLEDGKISFNVELTPQDRFLTLIVTDGFGSTGALRDYAVWNNDFFYLVDPTLQIAVSSD